MGKWEKFDLAEMKSRSEERRQNIKSHMKAKKEFNSKSHVEPLMHFKQGEGRGWVRAHKF